MSPRTLPASGLFWMDHAECQTESPELFFGPDAERHAERKARELEAKAVCLRCPVLHDCWLHATDRPEEYGYWAATSEGERAAARRRRLGLAA